MTQTILRSFAIARLARQFFTQGLPAFAGIVMATGGTMPAAMAQSACQPPSSGEFLLLVVSPTPETQTRVRNLVARDANVTVCNYFGQIVTRVGGYRDGETASSWANYLNETVGIQAFVVRPSNGQTAQIPETPTAPMRTSTGRTSTGRTSAGTFNPQRLGDGFAVIVNYYNRPELAVSVRQALNRNIGLVSYGQRPFLLAAYTRDRRTAETILQRLSDRGFAATIVNSRQVTLLTPTVNLPQAVGGQ